MEEMISVQALTKTFGAIQAVRQISFTVNKGEVLGFLGPNGAGKSTTMKMITGFLTPTSGTATVCGCDIQRAPIEAKRHIGYLPEGAPLYADMSASGFLRFAAAARGLRGKERQAAVDRSVQLAQLESVIDQPIETLSKGFKRRVGLAQALIHDPDVLVLDEPTDGLDPNQKHDVRKIITDMAPEKAIIISTHILEEVDALCSRALIIAKGEVVADGTPDALMEKSARHNAVAVRFSKGIPASAREDLLALPAISSVDVHDESANPHLLVHPTDGAPIAGAIGDLVRDKKWELVEFGTERGNLEEVFRNLTNPTESAEA
jgi:ABC-2 type transport system ATP-binding protein